MAITLNAKAFSADMYKPDAITYFGPAHTGSVKDDLLLGRQASKPTSVFSGVYRSTIQLKRTVTLTGSLTPTGEMTVTVLCTIPVGTAGADVDSILNDLGAGLSGASVKLIAKNQQIAW